MSDSSDSEDGTYQQPSTSTTSLSPSSASADTPPPPPPPPCGCAYLQAVHAQIRAGSYTTTSGDYLETIFTHRETFYAFPPGHRTCALGFSELANGLAERQRAWRPDWDGDSEAVSAFRHEAWVIANAF
ncbi:hypothetical protein C8Q80DRAFT_496499 [Daedaleopsis nitida]|nr:hypothetical protein C8Q80DRAFT_496499 [Daedaleopsis nitida]